MPVSTIAVVKAPNYTDAMVAAIHAQAAIAPLNMESAKALGEQLGKSYKSIIAKAKREGLAYEAKEVAPKKGQDAPTKAAMVEVLSEVTGLKLLQLDKAPTATLIELCKYIASLMPVVEETPLVDELADADAS